MTITRLHEESKPIKQVLSNGQILSAQEYGSLVANTVAKVTPLSKDTCDVLIVDMPSVFEDYLGWIPDEIRLAYPNYRELPNDRHSDRVSSGSN